MLHDRFDGLASLDEVDKQVAAWRDAVKDGSARAGAWPGFVNIPSKIGQVAAVRALAEQRRERDITGGILLAAVCPGMMNTPTSGMWWDVSDAPSPADAAVALLDLAFNAVERRPLRPARPHPQRKRPALGSRAVGIRGERADRRTVRWGRRQSMLRPAMNLS